MKKYQRRSFLKLVPVSGGLLCLDENSRVEVLASVMDEIKPKVLTILTQPTGESFSPLDPIEIETGEPGEILVFDGSGNLYFSEKTKGIVRFKAGGCLGYHLVFLLGKRREVKETAKFKVSCSTLIVDQTGEFNRMFKLFLFTLFNSTYFKGKMVRYEGELYHYVSSWMQDHLYVMQGMKYFTGHLKSCVDLYSKAQREDGMIHDNYKHPLYKLGEMKRRFGYGNFQYHSGDPNSTAFFVRVPVENIAEYTYIEALYQAWKNTGDHVWMQSKLESALKALHYATHNELRWSAKYQLLKRGFTIDMWDFQCDEDARIAGNDIMRIEAGKTRFGIFFGDNIRMSSSCSYLAEMLKFAGREKEAMDVLQIGMDLKERIDQLSWNGEHYTHHQPENSDYIRDFGTTDQSRQVTMGNSYALNHGIGHKQAVAIIRTYQRIRKEMPEESPGEWYCCYPPFEKGFRPSPKWEYMNGGVTPIVAGQLARGAFEHGFEEYGTDILRRIAHLGEKTGNKLEGCYKGNKERPAQRFFYPLDIKEYLNANFSGSKSQEKIFATGSQETGLNGIPTGAVSFAEIPFLIGKSELNHGKTSLLLDGSDVLNKVLKIPVGRQARSFYFLHTLCRGHIAGRLIIQYRDETFFEKTIAEKSDGDSEGEIANWGILNFKTTNRGIPTLLKAWENNQDSGIERSVFIYALNNPFPQKEIVSIQMEAIGDEARWMILGITLSGQEAYLEPSFLSYGIPEHWGAGDCMYALIEGLAGINNEGTAMDKLKLVPRWESATDGWVKVFARLEDSGGYAAYSYKRNEKGNIEMSFTSSAADTTVEILLPPAKNVSSTFLDGQLISHQLRRVENSSYVILNTSGRMVHTIEILLT